MSSFRIGSNVVTLNYDSSQSAPYAPTTAGVGGSPDTSDIIACAIFLTLFIAGAACNMTIFQVNKRRGHHFIWSMPIFGFCMARIVTCIMRMVWATQPDNIKIGIAANVFFNAGIVLVYLLNLVFGLRLLETVVPRYKAVRIAFGSVGTLLALSLIATIVSVIQSFFTLSLYTHRVDRNIQRATSCLLLVIACCPYAILAWAITAHRKTTVPKEIGTAGTWRTKAIVLLASTTLAVWIAGFRCGTVLDAARPVQDPAWYDSKACFYFFGFIPEISIVSLFVGMRVDRLFHLLAAGNAAQPGKDIEKSESMTTLTS